MSTLSHDIAIVIVLNTKSILTNIQLLNSDEFSEVPIFFASKHLKIFVRCYKMSLGYVIL